MSHHTLSLAEQIAALESGQLSSVDLVSHYIERIKQLEPKLNVLITDCFDRALQEAAEADKRRSAGKPLSELDGIPIIQKDIFCTEGVRTTCGSKMLEDFIPPYESTLTARCQAAGLILLGKANMDEFAMGSTNENSAFGPTRNPWDLDSVPGGSSGASASAVAAGLTPLATGTDTGGSIRQPASYCGITGLKPTYGRVSRYGMVAFASSLDQAGPMARSAEDCAHLLNIIAGYDPKDSTSHPQKAPDYTQDLNKPLESLTIGYPRKWLDEHLSEEMMAMLQNVIAVYEDMGAQLVDVDLPRADLAVATYYIIAPCECSSNLARYDGVRYGHRSEQADSLIDMYKNTRSEGFGSEVKRRILTGTYCLSSGFYDAYYVKAQKVRTLINEDFDRAFASCDVILTPTAPGTAYKLGSNEDDPINMYLSDLFTIPANLTGLPAISAPGGLIDGMPVGFQLFGRAFDESTLLRAIHQYQQRTDWHRQQPTINDQV